MSRWDNFSSRNFSLRRQVFGRQADLSEIAAPADCFKVTNFEHENTHLENWIKKKAGLADIFSGMESSWEKDIYKHPYQEADLFLCLLHLNPYSLKEKKARDSFSRPLHSRDNGKSCFLLWRCHLMSEQWCKWRRGRDRWTWWYATQGGKSIYSCVF